MASQQPLRRVMLQVKSSVNDPLRVSTETVYSVFPGDRILVGRSPDFSQIAIDFDPSMSKKHFELAFDGVSCEIRDIGSANGTWVNGQPVTDAVVLANGDEITAGVTTFGVAIMGTEPKAPVETAELPAEDAPAPAAEEAKEDDSDATIQHTPKIAILKIAEDSTYQDDGSLSLTMAWIRAGQELVIGSSRFDADWWLPEKWGVVARHFKINYDGTDCLLAESDASNTLVNGTGVTSVKLQHGDRIVAGQVTFEIELM
jgi:predicted component of type VI protein secretion system